MTAQVRIGACGFSYKEWLGAFYPPLTRVGEGAEEIYVYFKHETGAPDLAARLGRLLADGI